MEWNNKSSPAVARQRTDGRPLNPGVGASVTAPQPAWGGVAGATAVGRGPSPSFGAPAFGVGGMGQSAGFNPFDSNPQVPPTSLGPFGGPAPPFAGQSPVVSPAAAPFGSSAAPGSATHNWAL